MLVRHATSRLKCLLVEISIVAMLLGAAPGAVNAAAVPTSNTLSVEAGGGKVVTLNGSAANVFVADPKVAEVRPASASTLFVFGVGAGHTTVAALDSDGHLISQYEVTVLPSHFGASEAQATIQRMLPGSRVTVQPTASGLLLVGQVDNPGEAAQAKAVAQGFLSGTQTVDNELNIQSSVQVTLQVRVAEMSRQVVRNLGVNWQAIGNIGSIGTLALTTPGGALTSPYGALASQFARGQTSISTVLDALAQDNLAHILAEPSLTVMSGQVASFLAGGEFPVPVSEQLGTVSVEFKKFGVSLNFLPTVFSDGRISVHVAPEVSSLSNQNAVTIGVGSTSGSGGSTTNSSFTIPSLIVQRAETTVELGSGQTFAIAGLLQDVVQHNASGLPFLGDVPILGPLFRSDAFNRQQSELVILVTPYVVKPVSTMAALHTPDENYAPAGELDRLLLLHQTAKNQPATPVVIPGAAGFVVQ
jgi:pilus assembly protein CpaC